MSQCAKKTITCKYCKKQFELSNSYLKTQEKRGIKCGIFCSRSCYYADERETPKPDNYTCSKCDITYEFNNNNFGKRKEAKFGLETICKKCTAKIALPINLESQKRLRFDVLSHYSNGNLQCACCRIKEYEFLTLDHANGDGNEERKTMSQQSIMRKLRRLGYPIGYRVLCWNCNCSRGIYGYCPHEKIKRADIKLGE